MSNTFNLTAELLNGFCQKGLTVDEMATEITNLSGMKCSVGTVRKACKHYNISLKAKPRKSAFVFGEANTNTNQNVETTETVGELAEVNA